MTLEVNWEEPVISETDVLQLEPQDLDGFYASAGGVDKSNLFFVLLTSFQHDLGKGRKPNSGTFVIK